jgi:RHS repeat-associated protein
MLTLAPRTASHALPRVSSRVQERLRTAGQVWPRPAGCKTASRKNLLLSRLFACARPVASGTVPRESALFPVASMSGATHHMNARVYDPDIGRFLSPDPTIPYPNNPQSFNRYSYTQNNPLNRVDPDGFQDANAQGAVSPEENNSNTKSTTDVSTDNKEAKATAQGANNPKQGGTGSQTGFRGTTFAEEVQISKVINQYMTSGCRGGGCAAQLANMQQLNQSLRAAGVDQNSRMGLSQTIGQAAGIVGDNKAAAEALALGGIATLGQTTASNPLSNARFAQAEFSKNFSKQGNFKGASVESVVAQLKTGQLKPSDVPVEYIVRDQNTLMLNTRSAVALTQAGIPRSEWVGKDMTGVAAAEARLSAQLARSELSNKGISYPRPNWK